MKIENIFFLYGKDLTEPWNNIDLFTFLQVEMCEHTEEIKIESEGDI